MELPPARNRYAPELGSNGGFLDYGKKHATKNSEMFATVRLVEEDLRRTNLNGWSFRGTVDHIYAIGLRCQDLGRRKDDGRVFVAVFRVDSNANHIPLLQRQDHSRSGCGDAGTELMNAISSSERAK